MGQKRAPSKQASAVLEALAANPRAWSYGYSLMKATGLSSGTLYPLLIRLSEDGLLEAEWRPAEKEGRPPRHAYRLTGEGFALAHSLSAAKAARRDRLAET